MPPRASSDVSLAPELGAYSALVVSGRDRSASGVVRTGRRLLQHDKTAVVTHLGPPCRTAATMVIAAMGTIA